MTRNATVRSGDDTPLRRLLSLPIVGFAPWLLLVLVEGPGRVALASGLACALAIAITASGAAIGRRPKLLEVSGIVVFGLMLIVVVAFPDTRHWLGLWAAEICNAVIALVTVGSIVARRPFTVAYAREMTEREHWDSPLFMRVNYALSSAWATAFLASAIVGYLGDGPLHDPTNIWTNWVIQVALVIAAIAFTNWYPHKALARYSPEPA
ncbi:hypothetical protein [Flexivirga caeni]|uniref:DUF3159 domain-containing protein n=1 Tax=Flexivirga caeni TaxID=2294115 RepID=A0A3M9M9K6_9MICO|nr:hypothetical protein [Flexivirga caeni]RNI22234.1 hypothetical protein EFY87_09675 [Flexivirga caeni]